MSVYVDLYYLQLQTIVKFILRRPSYNDKSTPSWVFNLSQAIDPLILR